MRLLKKWLWRRKVANIVPSPMEGDLEVLRLTSHGPHGFVLFCFGAKETSIVFYMDLRDYEYETIMRTKRVTEFIAANFERWEKLGVFNGRLQPDPGNWKFHAIR